MANVNIKRNIREDGIVVEKIFKEATDEFKMSDGRVVSAQPDRYILKVVSGEEFSKENGFLNSNVMEYKVERNVFEQVKAYSPVEVKYEMSSFGVKPVSCILKN